MEYTNQLERLGGVDHALGAELAGFHSLENVLAWMKQRGLPLATLDLVTQDELTHDVLIPLESRWLAFGITCFGELTAVAVWGHKPSADELLARRLEDGWRPTASRLQEGRKVLGHAACVATHAVRDTMRA